jgi:hypothetical protein
LDPKAVQAQEFVKNFIKLWGDKAPREIAALCAFDAHMLTVTGLWCEGRIEIEKALSSEMVGLFHQARIVLGRSHIRTLSSSAEVATQRLVVSGLVDAQGQDLGRVGAILTLVLSKSDEGHFQAVSVTFSPLSQ